MDAKITIDGKKKQSILFVGFKRDYERFDLYSIKGLYNIKTISIPNFIIFIVSKLRFFFKEIDIKIYTCILNILMPKNIDVIISTDDYRYFNWLASLSKPTAIIFRNKYGGEYVEKIRDISCYSFDDSDCFNFSFQRYDQFASGFEYIKRNAFGNRYDLTFIGVDKGREALIKSIENELSDLNIFIKVFPLRRFDCVSQLLGERYSYTDYLDTLLNTNAVLEIVQKNQVGVSMRFLEALLAGKKVLTNNEAVKEHELYNSEQVFIFKDLNGFMENLERIKIFLLGKNFKRVSVSDKYSPKYTLGNIIRELSDNQNAKIK